MSTQSLYSPHDRFFRTIFSHARQPWRFPLDSSSLVAIHSEQEQRHTPCSTAELYETAGRSPGEIRGGAHFVAAVRTLHERQRMIGHVAPLISQMRDALPDPSEFRELLTVILAYLAQVSPGEKNQLSRAVRESRYRPAEDAMMTIAEQWIAEGMQKGRVEGRAEGWEQGLIADKLDSAIDEVITASEKTEILPLLR